MIMQFVFLITAWSSLEVLQTSQHSSRVKVFQVIYLYRFCTVCTLVLLHPQAVWIFSGTKIYKIVPLLVTGVRLKGMYLYVFCTVKLM